MKRIIYYIITLMAATSAINSCDTLEQMPVDKLYEDNAFLTEDDLALYTNSFYTMFPSAYNVFYADRISEGLGIDGIRAGRYYFAYTVQPEMIAEESLNG